MPVRIRPANLSDIPAMAELMVSDAQMRAGLDPVLWRVADDALAKISDALQFALAAERQPFRQAWLVAFDGATLAGIAHTILLPVPPIYAGESGAPGLIMEDCCVAADAPSDTLELLLDAAQSDLRAAGAKIIVGSSVAGGAWGETMVAHGYEPLMLYLGKTGLRADEGASVGTAQEDDIPGLVAVSAENREVLFAIDPFWKPHDEADARFGAWMSRSLTLSDRDMLVSRQKGAVTGYAISQPVTPLHLPAAHDITATGIIDDWYHPEMLDPVDLNGSGAVSSVLLRRGEADLAKRNNNAALVVCPAGWQSKQAVLESQGYETAITWYIKR